MHSQHTHHGWRARPRVVLSLVFLSLAVGAAGAEPRTDLPLPVLMVSRTTGTVQVDGKPGEPAWDAAACIPMLQDWNTGEVVRPDTTVRVCWNDRGLYVAWDCREPRMD